MECSHETASFRQVKGGRENTAPILKAKNFTGKKCHAPYRGVITGQMFHLIRNQKLWILGGEDKDTWCETLQDLRFKNIV